MSRADAVYALLATASYERGAMMNGGGGADTLTGAAANDLRIGGTGNDAITTTSAQ